MRKWSILFVLVFLVLAAATVFAVQNYVLSPGSSPLASSAVDEIEPQPYSQSASGSECGGTSGCGVAGASGCGSSSSGGCGAPSDPAVSKRRVEGIQNYLYAYFSEKLGDPGITIKVDDYGCHQEASVLKDGKIIKRLSISGNSISEIPS